MKKIGLLILAIAVVLTMSACEARSIGIIGGAGGPTNIVVDSNKQYRNEKEPVKAIMLDGYIYYETGEDNDIQGRCGTLDGCFTKTVDKWELPKNDNEANFELKNKDYCGYQAGFAEGTIEVPIGDDWEIFKRLETEQDVSKYKYILKVEGEIEGRMDDVEYIILANTLDLTANDIANTESSPADRECLVIKRDFD